MFDNTTIMVIITTLTVIILVIIIVVFFSIFQNRKIKFLFEQQEIQRRFDDEIIKSQLETQEQTLQNISWELHDNIGQLLSVANMQINILKPKMSLEQQQLLNETSEIISKSLQEIRSLSKLLNPEVIKNIGLVDALQLEIDRFNRLNFIEATLIIKGETQPIDQKDEIILFRILQEFLSNSLKHSKTNKLEVKINYEENLLMIEARDFGVGFNQEEHKIGSGLINMKSRATLINAKIELLAEKNKGVYLTLTYPLKENHA
ncbi:histidine kinase [Flavobacteriaceae bacterium F08102]|nr:histidine kinase [Flavobacteriaceae bacterium F08102]